MGRRAQPADGRAQVVGEAVGQQTKLFHQGADAVEHGVDLLAEAIESVAGARYGHALRQVTGADPVGNGGNVADPAADIMGGDHAAQQTEQAGDDQRDQQRRSSVSRIAKPSPAFGR